MIYPSGDMEEIFRTYFSGLLKEMSQKDKFYIEIAKNTANALVMYVFRLINRYRNMTELSADNSSLETVLAYIDKHYLEAVSLEQIAGACHISKYYLSHLFSDVTQQTVGQYILNRRLAHAAHLLAVTKMPRWQSWP